MGRGGEFALRVTTNQHLLGAINGSTWGQDILLTADW